MELKVDDYFASSNLTNSLVLCVGGITRSETEQAQEEGLDIDGNGYYVFIASESEPQKPIEILAKFVSNSAAEKLARLFQRQSFAH